MRLKKVGITTLASAMLIAPVLSGNVNAARKPKKEVGIDSEIRSTMATSSRIDKLKEAAIYYYWNGGQLKKNEKNIFKGITLKSNFAVMEQIFKQAISIDPADENLQMDLAAVYQMQNKNNDAIELYKQILVNNPQNYNARLKLASIEYLKGDVQAYETDINKLNEINKEKTKKFKDLFAGVNKIGDLKINTTIPVNLSNTKDNYIVLLGYALDDKGNMQKPMLDRLKLALKVAKKYPNSMIITCGGVPKNGKNEATVMARWLTKHGVNKSRIIKEDLSTNTTENALFASRRLVDRGAKSMVLITSLSHMRRAYFLFNEAQKIVLGSNTSKNKSGYTIEQVAMPDDMSLLNNVLPAEKNATMSDALRINGIWQLPGLQR